jgi:outer membrane protein OmpA-like peptidoglycan-associated protein
MRTLLWLTLATSSLACAYVPTQALQDARAAYTKAEKSNAATLAPADLRQAHLSLAEAERADRDDPGSYKAIDLAYVAIRRAQLAEARGDIEQATRMRDAAEKELSAATGQQLEETKKQMAKLREDNERMTRLTEQQKQQAEEARQTAALAEKRADEALAEVARLEKVTKDQRGQVITLPSGLLFKSGKAILSAAARPRLDEVAQALQKIPDRRLIIEGHTDSSGDEDTNIDLSEKRAKAVKDYLVMRGVPEARLTIVGAGPSRPIADNATRDGRAMNRRVEIVVAAPDEDRAIVDR